MPVAVAGRLLAGVPRGPAATAAPPFDVRLSRVLDCFSTSCAAISSATWRAGRRAGKRAGGEELARLRAHRPAAQAA
jgi:hypothetical protein